MGSALLLAASAAMAHATPATVAGWPVPGLDGPVLPGPGGGVVGVYDDPFTGVVAAFRPDGRVRWTNVQELACGNCDFGPQPVRLQPNGTYGPMGAVGDDYWAVDRDGRRVAGCTGAVAADGTCTRTSFRFGPGADLATLVVSAGQRWRYEEPDFTPGVEGDVMPPVVADRSGTVYVALPAGVVASTRAEAPGRLLALDAATGALRWRLEGEFTVLTGLSTGVLVTDRAGAVSAVDAGAVRWTVADAVGATQRATFSDPARRRVYVGLQPTEPPLIRRTLAIDEDTGEVAWRTAVRDQALPLAVGGEGVVYVAVKRDGWPSLRAITPAGRGAWQLPTNGPVIGAAEVAGGRVALTTGAAEPSSFLAGTTAILIDPARRAPVPRRRSFALTSTRPRGCDLAVTLDPARCTTLRMALPRATRLRLRVRTPRGRLAEFDQSVPAPRGTSSLRLLFGRRSFPRGRNVLEIRAGGRVVRRLPFTVG